MEWFDIGVNLTSHRFKDDYVTVVSDARQAGVSGMLLTGTSVADSHHALQQAIEIGGACFSTAGIHPHYSCDAQSGWLDELYQLAGQPAVKAIGECGLDFNRMFSDEKTQLRVFEQQLELAGETGKPVFLHERDAFDQQIRLLKVYQHRLVGGVAHCFTGSRQQMDEYLQLGLYIGVTGWICDDKRGGDLRDALPHLPLSRLLLETDAPYLVPKTIKPRPARNVPALLPEVGRQVAQLYQLPIELIAKHSTTNALQLFAGQDDVKRLVN